MPHGTVKWFNNAKGYGFILPNDSNEDIFAHYSAISMDGYKTLKAGQEVYFDIVEGEKGLHATNITPINSSKGQTKKSESVLPKQVDHLVSKTEAVLSAD